MVKTNNNIEISDMFKINNTMSKNPKTITDQFYDYFNEMGYKYASNIFFMIPTGTIEISRIITSLKPKTNSGHDRISPKLLKYLTPSISVPISVVIN